MSQKTALASMQAGLCCFDGKENLNWRSFADTKQGDGYLGPICAAWNLTGTPTIYVLDDKGVIRHKWLGGPGEQVIDATLQKLIKEAERGSK